MQHNPQTSIQHLHDFIQDLCSHFVTVTDISHTPAAAVLVDACEVEGAAAAAVLLPSAASALLRSLPNSASR